MKAEDDKTRQLNKHTLMAFSGEAGDTGELLVSFSRVDEMLTLCPCLVQFAEFIQANIQLYSMRNDTELSPAAVSSFVRGELARSLRSRSPYTVNLLLGGLDPVTEQPSLYWVDYLASLAPVPYAAHGYAQYVRPIVDAWRSLRGAILLTCSRYYCLSLLDKHHNPNISLDEGMKLLQMCTDELKRRLPIDYKGVSYPWSFPRVLL